MEQEEDKRRQARKRYWASMTPEERSKRMSAIAAAKQKKWTFKQKRDHALKMVKARQSKSKKKTVV